MKNPSRILMILDHSFPPDLRVENEARTLISAGFEVAILAIGEDKRPELDNLDGLIIYRYRLSDNVRNKLRGLAGSVPLIEWVYGRKIKEIFKLWPFDALHAHDLYLFGACLRAGRSLGVRVVGDMHENWVHALSEYRWSTRFPGKFFINLKQWDKLETRWSKEVDQLVVVVDEMKERMLKKSLRADHIVIVPNTINREHFDEMSPVSEPAPENLNFRSGLRLIYTGGMDLHRGLASLIAAMPAIRRSIPEATLRLVGDGAIRGDLELQSKALGLEHIVSFEGWQPQDSIPEYIRRADIGLIPHLKSMHTDNTIPHKLFHYMYLGLPVVASDCNPLKRIIGEENVGLVYPSGDSDELALAVIKLAQRPELRNQMGKRGEEAVSERYNWEHTSKDLLVLYKSLLGN